MISAECAIPEGVFGSDDIDIINDGVSNWREIMRVGDVHEPNKHGHAYGEEEEIGLVGIFGSKAGVHFDGIDEIAFGRVDALAGAIVKQGRLPFFIHKDLQLFLHFQVAPAIAVSFGVIFLINGFVILLSFSSTSRQVDIRIFEQGHGS